MQYVAEFKRELLPGEFARWQRRGTPAAKPKDEQYFALWRARANGEKPPKRKSDRTPLPVCPHLGADTGETIGCRSCARAGPLSIYECAKHGRTTLAKPGKSDSLACCKYCPDNPANAKPEPPVDHDYATRYAGIGKRHLIYHLLPVAGNGVWQRNVDELWKRWNRFDGRKLIAVAWGDDFRRGDGHGERDATWTLDSLAKVRAALPHDAEVFSVPNNPKLREVASWPLLVNEIANTAADEDVVLYAHAKGVTRSAPPDQWTTWLYELALDYPERVEALLAKHPVVGSFRKDGPAFGGKAQWHYSGTFFWFRAGDMKRRPWQTMPKAWWGVEGWPGVAYGRDEAGVLFGTGGAELDLYKSEVVERIARELAEWRASA